MEVGHRQKPEEISKMQRFFKHRSGIVRCSERSPVDCAVLVRMAYLGGKGGVARFSLI